MTPIDYGGGLIFPLRYTQDPPDPPDNLPCPECTEDRWPDALPCPHCGHLLREDEP